MAMLIGWLQKEHSLPQGFYYCQSINQINWVGDKSSSFADCISGVPQGSNLGPLLFYIYIKNDLPQACPDVNIQIYAVICKI